MLLQAFTFIACFVSGMHAYRSILISDDQTVKNYLTNTFAPAADNSSVEGLERASGDLSCHIVDVYSGAASKQSCSSFASINPSDPFRCMKLEVEDSRWTGNYELKRCAYRSECTHFYIDGRCASVPFQPINGGAQYNSYACCCSGNNCNAGVASSPATFLLLLPLIGLVTRFV